MDALIVYPENKAQMAAVKAVMKAMKISFEEKDDVYPEQVINGVRASLLEADEGKLTPYTGIKDMLGKK